MMDNNVFAAIVCMVCAYFAFSLILLAICAILDRVHERRRFRFYDGGCRHESFTCSTCLTERWSHPSQHQS